MTIHAKINFVLFLDPLRSLSVTPAGMPSACLRVRYFYFSIRSVVPPPPAQTIIKQLVPKHCGGEPGCLGTNHIMIWTLEHGQFGIAEEKLLGAAVVKFYHGLDVGTGALDAADGALAKACMLYALALTERG